MNNKFYERCIKIVSNLKLNYEEVIARDVILNELDMLEKQAIDYQMRFNKVIEIIDTNFKNEDGTIWHTDMKTIKSILEGERKEI